MSPRRIVLSLAVAGLLAGPVVYAQEHEQEAAKAGAEAGGSETEHEHEVEAAEGIVNWWSWDYGTAAKDPTHRGWPPPFGFALLNFAIFLGIMSKLAWKPLQKFLVDRHFSIAKDLDAAAKLRAEAEATLKQYEAKVAGIGAEIDILLKQIHKQAEEEKARIIALAEADAKRLREEAARQIATEIDSARRELRRGVIEAAIAAADEAVKKNIAPDDQRKMAERYVTDVEQQTKPAGSLS
jgi:F-type H+-transporting ATPase subunit b